MRSFSSVYVILVTARSEEVDKLIGLGVGADDYVTKPFSPREVTARVKAVLRRRGQDNEPPASLSFDNVQIDLAGRTVIVDSRTVAVSALEFVLLSALAGAPGRVFSRTQLLQQVWGYDFYGDERVVDVHIRSLRALLGDDANDPHAPGSSAKSPTRCAPRTRRSMDTSKALSTVSSNQPRKHLARSATSCADSTDSQTTSPLFPGPRNSASISALSTPILPRLFATRRRVSPRNSRTRT